MIPIFPDVPYDFTPNDLPQTPNQRHRKVRKSVGQQINMKAKRAKRRQAKKSRSKNRKSK